MSAFSRGFFLRWQCNAINSHFYLLPTRMPQPRFLATSSILSAVIRTASNPAHKRAPSSLSSIPRVSPSPTAIYQTYASRLAQKPHPTLLYLAPPHTGFIICSYIMAGFCFTFAITFFWSNYLHAPPDISSWVPFTFVGICFFMVAVGGFFVLGPAWIVKSMTAMPISALNAAGVSSSLENGVAKGMKKEELKIEIELRRLFPIPFFPAKKLYVRPEEIRLAHNLARPGASRSPAEMRALKGHEKAETEKALEYERTHIMSGPFRHISRAFFDLFLAARRSWTREGFTGIYVKRYKYKLDVSGGWALDGGRALDRLVAIRLED